MSVGEYNKWRKEQDLIEKAQLEAKQAAKKEHDNSVST